MWRSIRHTYRLGLKELISLRYDYVLLVLLAYSFSVMIVVPSRDTGLQVRNASIAVVDEDHSVLSHRIRESLLPPYFQKAVDISLRDVNLLLDRSIYTFVLIIPPHFEKNLLSGRTPEIQVNVDATATGQAKIGTTYLKKIIHGEVAEYLKDRQLSPPEPVRLNTRILFNPNLDNHWFMGLIMLSQMITMLSIILPGAALLREKEHGTVEHLLVMPVGTSEIMIAKVWANSLVVIFCATVSLFVFVHGVLGVPLNGSLYLLFIGTVIYLFATTGLGIFTATFAQNSAQLGLLLAPILTPLLMLSGSFTPMEAQPMFLQTVMSLSPTTHFIEFEEAIVFRGAGFDVVWLRMAAFAAIGSVLFIGSMLRFRATFR
ncbi:MAG: ABC transporter permease [Syntrophales bacterium]|jgi:ABC-2 type transport system permease protein